MSRLIKVFRESGGNSRGPLMVVVLIWLCGQAAVAQEPYTFSATIQGSIGGAMGADEPDPGLGNVGFQVGFSWVIQPRTHVVVRFGQVSFSDERLETLFDPELSYAVIAGEYTYQESYYTSGIYLGLGIYNLEGIKAGATSHDTSIGVAFGITGDFPMTRRFFILAELSAHYADLDQTQLFGFFHIGAAFRF